MNILSLVFLLTLSFSAYATRTPFHPFEQKKFAAVDQKTDLLDSTKVSYLRTEYDFTAGPKAANSVFSLSGSIPAGALVIQAFLRAKTVITSADSSSIQMSCGGFNIFGLSPVVLNGVPAGYTEAMVGPVFTVASACTPTLTLGSEASGITGGIAEAIFIYVE